MLFSPEVGLENEDGRVITAQEIVDDDGNSSAQDSQRQRADLPPEVTAEIDALAREAVESVEKQLSRNGAENRANSNTERKQKIAENEPEPGTDAQDESDTEATIERPDEPKPDTEADQPSTDMPNPNHESGHPEATSDKAEEPVHDVDANAEATEDTAVEAEDTTTDDQTTQEDVQGQEAEVSDQEQDTAEQNQVDEPVNEQQAEAEEEAEEQSNPPEPEAEEPEDSQENRESAAEEATPGDENEHPPRQPDDKPKNEQRKPRDTTGLKVTVLSDEEIAKILGIEDESQDTTRESEAQESPAEESANEDAAATSGEVTEEDSAAEQPDDETIVEKQKKSTMLIPGFTDEEDVKRERGSDVVAGVRINGEARDALADELDSLVSDVIADVERKGSVEQVRSLQQDAVAADVTASEALYEEQEQAFLSDRYSEIAQYTNDDPTETPLRTLYEEEVFEAHIAELKETYEQTKAQRLGQLEQFKEHVDLSVYEDDDFGIGRMSDSEFEAVLEDAEAVFETGVLRTERREGLDAFKEHVDIDEQLANIDLAELSEEEFNELLDAVNQAADEAIAAEEKRLQEEAERKAAEEEAQRREAQQRENQARSQGGTRPSTSTNGRNNASDRQQGYETRNKDNSPESVEMGMPFSGNFRVSSEYGMRVHPISGERSMHHGIDFAMPTGTPLLAVKDAVVVYSGMNGSQNSGYGNTVMLYSKEHDMTFIYAHLDTLGVEAGDRVNEGEMLGTSGETGSATGPHLHLEVRYGDVRDENGKYVGVANAESTDPADYLFTGAHNGNPETTREAQPETAEADDPMVERVKPLLTFIMEHEAVGNYNAHYGNGKNTEIKFTEMSVGEVLAWQDHFVDVLGKPSSAVGGYQFIRGTLRGLVQGNNIRMDAKFDEALQDKLALSLLEGRGLSKYLNGEISEQQFILNLSKEWAALPKGTGSNPQASYYDGDGLNSAQVSLEEVRSVVRSLK